jgi:hypothetical protein
MNYRNPYIRELEYKVSELEAMLRMYEFDKPYYTTLYEDPGKGPYMKKDLEFVRVASAGIEFDINQHQWHFTSYVVTPPSLLKVNYYFTNANIDEAKSSYDVIGYLTEDIMNKFYRELVRKDVL